MIHTPTPDSKSVRSARIQTDGSNAAAAYTTCADAGTGAGASASSSSNTAPFNPQTTNPASPPNDASPLSARPATAQPVMFEFLGETLHFRLAVVWLCLVCVIINSVSVGVVVVVGTGVTAVMHACEHADTLQHAADGIGNVG